MSDNDDEILDMDDNIHWVEREEGNFLQDHPEINTFIIINANSKNKIDYKNTFYNGIIGKYDDIFTADIINNYMSPKNNILHVLVAIQNNRRLF